MQNVELEVARELVVIDNRGDEAAGGGDDDDTLSFWDPEEEAPRLPEEVEEEAVPKPDEAGDDADAAFWAEDGTDDATASISDAEFWAGGDDRPSRCVVYLISDTYPGLSQEVEVAPVDAAASS